MNEPESKSGVGPDVSAATVTQPIAGVVVRGGKDVGKPASVPSPPSGSERVGKLALWSGVIVVGLAMLASVVWFSAIRIRDVALTQADEPTIRANLATTWPAGESADYLETLSELALQLPEPDKARALVAAQRAVMADPSRAYAWATIAFLEADKARTVNAASIEALGMSMDACPLCSAELVQWRFNFVLSNWAAIPDPMRHRAFDHADMLRWTEGNAEFLGEMQLKAERAGVPFDAYRAAVKTPMPAWDLAPTRASGE